MADSAISSLTLAEAINGADLFVLEQNGTAKKLTGAKLASFIDRQVLDISVLDLAATAAPTSSYDRITGKLVLGIPRGNSITSITLDNNDQIVFHWADGTTQTCSTVKGDTGKSAYDYAVEQGYTGSETDFATLQIQLYEASVNENERVQAEQARASNYTYMMQRVENKITQMEGLISGIESDVVGTTLVLNTIDTSVVDTTLML